MPLEAADITALAEAIRTLQQPNQQAPVNATAVKLPTFWQGNPEVWFRQVESVFTTRNPAITTQQTKFEYVIQALDNSTADRVQNIILTPPENPYDALKAALIKAFGKSQAEKDQELLSLNGLGDRKPSELLQHMENLNTDRDTLFKALFLAQLPTDVRRILATSSKTDIKDLASEADRITEVSRLAQDVHVNAVEVNAAGAARGTTPKHQLGELRTGPSRSGTQMVKLPGLCKYHSTFGEQARKCTPPCNYQQVSGNAQAGRQ